MSSVAPMLIKNYLSQFPARIEQISLTLGILIKDTIPNLLERVYPGWRLIGYRQGTEKKSRYFCFVAPHADHVRLGFEYGAFLADPRGVLEGTGSQVRHVSIRTCQEIEKLPLTSLLEEAAWLALLPKHELLLLPKAPKRTVHDTKKRG